MPTPPYIKQLNQVGEFSVWQVDGEYIRNNINREFTNFAQHYRFKFIPKYEFWIDKECAPGETHFFVTHMLKEWHLMDFDVPYVEAVVAAGKAEMKERKKSELYKKIANRKSVVENNKIPPELYKTKLNHHSNGLVVWVVNGELVRDLYYIDFTEGGHHFVYDFVPFPEVWIDDDLSVVERPYVILHELHERNLMEQGMGYHPAHARSSIIEYMCRRRQLNVRDEIKKELSRMRVSSIR